MSKNKYAVTSINKVIVYAILVLIGFGFGTNFKVFSLGNLASANINIAKRDEISPKELKKQLDNKENKPFFFINVHTPYEGEIGKTNAFIDYDLIRANENVLPPDKFTPIVLYCKSGRMSKEAVKTLKDMGYKNVVHLNGGMDAWKSAGYELLDLSGIPSQVLPDKGFELPISWNDLGPNLIRAGVIDVEKFEKGVNPTSEQKNILEKGSQNKITIDSDNAQYVVDMLWAFGLAQKSKVYDEGPMGKEYKDRIGNFASTGGWTLAKGNATLYLNKYDFLNLTPGQQDKVVEISKHVFRPCCGNSTWFPDCNHGMAALAAIELMVKKGLSDDEIYRNVLKLNSFWFPQHYLMVATYMARQGSPWDSVDAKIVLDQAYSSGQAAGEMYKKVGPLPYDDKTSSGSCGA